MVTNVPYDSSGTPMLTICIPTYNFGAYIGETIESIRNQYVVGTEIVVLDGGSTDNTAEVVARYLKICPYLRYHQQGFKGGIDADMARTVSLARGRFCWLLSADDALVPGTLERMHGEIKSGHDIYLCNRVLCDKALNQLHPQAWLEGGNSDFEFVLNDDKALSVYLGRATSVGALFGYMSVIVFKRESWNKISDEASLRNTNYAHVHRLFSMRDLSGRMKYLAAPLVLCRGENDSFLSQGAARRHLIDLEGFGKIANSLFSSNHQLRHQFKNVVNREHHWVTWVWLRSLSPDREEWEKIREALRQYEYSRLSIISIECLARMPYGVFMAHKLFGFFAWLSQCRMKGWGKSNLH